MLPIPIKILDSLLLAIASFYIVKNLLHSEEKLFTPKNIFLLLLLILPSCFLADIKYTTMILLLTFVLLIIIYKKIFRLTLSSTIVACSFVIVFVVIVDLALSIIGAHFITYKQARTVWYISLASNLITCIFSILLSKLRISQNCCKVMNRKMNNKQSMQIAFFAFIIVIMVAILYINITSVFKLNIYYTITIISIATFLVLYYFYITERNQYDKLNDEYNILFDYVQNFENWIDDEQLYRHELKNNLSILREMVKEKEAIHKIDDMLKINIIVDDQYIQQLKNVPKGGLKGLLYYKVAIAENNHVQMLAEVSPKVTEFIEKLPQKELKQLCILLGIYLDNAIEAASKTTKKLVALEIYELKDKLQFVVSNTYDQEIALDKINDKGYSTKGKNRGNGLYFAKKLIGKNKNMSSENILLNGYYIQKLLINIVEQ